MMEQKLLTEIRPVKSDDSLKIKLWNEKGMTLKEKMDEYTWSYIKKFCSKCAFRNSKKYNCISLQYWRDGFQETHCDKLARARTQKFKKEFAVLMSSHPLANRG